MAEAEGWVAAADEEEGRVGGVAARAVSWEAAVAVVAAAEEEEAEEVHMAVAGLVVILATEAAAMAMVATRHVVDPVAIAQEAAVTVLATAASVEASRAIPAAPLDATANRAEQQQPLAEVRMQRPSRITCARALD